MDGKITILINRENTIIELRDVSSSIKFLEIELTPEQLSSALSRLSDTECTFNLRGVENVGKTHEHKTFEFKLPDTDHSVLYKKSNKYYLMLKQHADSLLSDGWRADSYFGSQGTFFTKDGEKWARVIIRRYV